MTQDNATQTGADSLQPAHAGRNAALAQIAKQVDAGYQQDLASFNEETGEITPRQAPTQEQQTEPTNQGQAEEQNEGQDEQQPAQQQTAPTEDLETIVVDGQQVQVKRSQLLDAGKRTLQKEATADKRLQEATETLRQVQAYATQLRQTQPSQDAGQFSQSPSQDATNGNGLSRQQATPDLGTLVDERLWIHEATKAAQRFRSEFKDIADDPLLMRLAGQLEDERLAEAAGQGLPPGDPWEAYRKHGETIRARFLKPAPTQAQVTGTEDRLERKRSTTTVVGAGARMQPSQPQKPLSTAEIIEQQRLARQRGRQIQPAR
jgi:hypothetical protein